MPALKLYFAGLFVLCSALYGLTTLSASVPRWIVLYLWAVAICVAFLVYLWRRGWPRFDNIDGLACLLFAWAALSLFWSSDWRQGILEITNCAVLLTVFLWVRRNPDYVPEAAIMSVIGALVLQYLYPWDWGGHGNRNFQTEAILLGLFLGAQTERTWARHLLFIASVFSAWYLLLQNPSKIEFLVIPAVIGFYVLGNLRKFPDRARRALAQQHSGLAGQAAIRPRHRSF